jgi:hypothetical protein
VYIWYKFLYKLRPLRRTYAVVIEVVARRYMAYTYYYCTSQNYFLLPICVFQYFVLTSFHALFPFAEIFLLNKKRFCFSISFFGAHLINRA